MFRLLLLAGALTSFSSLVAQDADPAEKDPRVFNGHYAVQKKGCKSLYDGGYRRAYITVAQDARKNKEIRIDFYGDDSRIDSILLGKGSRKPLGAPEENKAVESWETTWKSDVHVVQELVTKSPFFPDFSETAELKIGKLNVEYKEVKKGTGDDKTLKCVLKPELRKEEKEAVCEQIKVWGEGEDNGVLKDLTKKNCLKGSFTVNGNDAGQLSVEYSAQLTDDEQWTCDVYFDKPLGDFEPAVESCQSH